MGEVFHHFFNRCVIVWVLSNFFLLKAQGLYLTILKRKNVSLPLTVETDQFVIWLALPECLSVKIFFAFYPSEAKRDGADAEFPFPLFISFFFCLI